MSLDDVRIFLTLTEKEMLILRYAMSQSTFKAKEDCNSARSRAEKYDFTKFADSCEELERKLMNAEHNTLRQLGLLKET